MTLWVITGQRHDRAPVLLHEHCHVEISAILIRKVGTMSRKTEIQDSSTTMSNVLLVHVGPPHNGQRRRPNHESSVGLNVTFDDDPQLEASTRYGSKPT
jgi:hypothetical protein